MKRKHTQTAAQRKQRSEAGKRGGAHMRAKAKERRKKHVEEFGSQTAYTPERGKLFCITLANTCNVGKSAESIGVTRRTVYTWREQFKKFAEEWDKAKAIGITTLEDEAVRRGGTDGVLEPVFYRGSKIAEVKKHSDTLLTFLLSAHKPEVYGKQRLEHSGPDGAPLPPVKMVVEFVAPAPEGKKR